MEEVAEFVTAFVAGVLFCIAVWLLFSQCGVLFRVEEMFSLRDFEVMYVR